MKRLLQAGVLCATAGLLLAADNPFVGTWKLNPDKSNFTGTTFTYSEAGPGEMKYTEGEQSYTFKTDGKERPAMVGYTAIWKKLDDHTWQSMSKVKGMVTDTDTLKVSADGKTLQILSEGKRPDGTSFHDSGEYARQSEGEGLIGKWKTTKVQISAPLSIVMKDFQGDGLMFYSAADKFTFSGRFDGSEGTVKGPTIPAGAGGTLKRLDANSFELTESFKGKVFWKGTYTISEDKKMINIVGGMVGGEQEKIVYDRQ